MTVNDNVTHFRHFYLYLMFVECPRDELSPTIFIVSHVIAAVIQLFSHHYIIEERVH